MLQAEAHCCCSPPANPLPTLCQHNACAHTQGLYQNPEDLSPLEGHPRARLLAHSMITASMLEKQLDTYRACTDTAKQLANVIESGQRTGVSTLLGAVRKLLPIPFLK